MIVLADSSIWIDYLRGRDPIASQLATLLDEGSVVLCGPVLAELLAGTPADMRSELRLALGALPALEIDGPMWHEAGERAFDLRRRGGTVPLLDIVIALAAVRAEADLWTRDRDFERVREVLGTLRLHTPNG